nr:thioredoxin [uncultured bacterium]
MAEMELSSRDDFEKTIKGGITLVDFNAPWCGPCRAQEEAIQKLKGEYAGRADVAEVNIDENREIAMGLGIQSIPTIILFKEGREIERFVGLQTIETLHRALENVLTEG